MNYHVSHHLLLCATPSKAKCCDPSIGTISWLRLKQILKELDLENPKRASGIVLRSKVDCLRICHEGPILLIWPDGIWYKKVTPEKIEAIIKEHIIKGKIVNKWILQKTPLNISI